MTCQVTDEFLLPMSRLGFRVWLADRAERGADAAARAVQLGLRGSRIQNIRGLRRLFAGTAQASMFEILFAQWMSDDAAAREWT